MLTMDGANFIGFGCMVEYYHKIILITASLSLLLIDVRSLKNALDSLPDKRMEKAVNFIQKRTTTLLLAVLLLASALFAVDAATTTDSAEAWWWSPRVIVIGNACPRGYISQISWNTDKESGNSYANGNYFSIDLKKVNSWGTGLHLSIKCNNNQWYGFYRWINRPGYGVYVNLGWV